MDYFNYHSEQLFAEDVSVNEIAAEYGTPCYIYSRATLVRHWHAFDQAVGEYPHQICYAVKANSNLAVLQTLAGLGSWFDIVSVGELERVLVAGASASNIVFSGVGKREDEIRRALEVGIACFNVESIAELDQIQSIAQQVDRQAAIAFRVNPNVDPKTHPYISTGLSENKFGIAIEAVPALCEKVAQYSHVRLIGIACHIGSQLLSLDPFLDALDCLLELVDTLKASGISIQHLDLGGGLGVRYQDENPPEPKDYAAAIASKMKGRDFHLLLEPGRAIAANAGILVTKVLLTKQTETHHFAIVDAGMNDLLRPALYQAWHDIRLVDQSVVGEKKTYRIVGPVCETGDFLGKDRELVLSPGTLLAVRGAGAYAMSMSSNYNSRPRVAEVMVDGKQAHLVRLRETVQDLFSLERLLPHEENR